MGLIKNDYEIELMRESCRIVAEVLKKIEGYIQPGITTKKLDSIIEQIILDNKGIPAFKGYGGSKKVPPFPASACISINEEVVHGIPSERILLDGDVVSIDVGVRKKGYYGDAAYTYQVGNVSDDVKRLLKVTEESLYVGISQAVQGNIIDDISNSIQTYCESSGFGVVRELVGHGVGSKLHEEPAIPNFQSPANSMKIRKGMTFAIEPMITYGEHYVKHLKDKWTVVTKDEKPAAHFEHTILITDSEPEILTLYKEKFVVKKQVLSNRFSELMFRK